MTACSRLYSAAARFIAPILLAPGVRSVYIRRSVSAGEAEFPWSDLDLGLVVEGFQGHEMNALRRRFLTARVLFPRLGECQIAAAAELTDLAFSDPYRAALDRRFSITVAGDPPAIPVVSVNRRAAARRLVYWFERYLPAAVRQGNLRNQRKFVLEMWNALGVIEGEWAEPLATRFETADRARAVGFIGSGKQGDNPFALCCTIAARAQRQMFPPAPSVRETVVLAGHHPLVVLPGESTPWPTVARRSETIVAIPAVLQLMLETQNPFLWLGHGPALSDLGFSPPSRQAWTDACIRHTGGERLRSPGFMEESPHRQLTILNMVEQVLEALERDQLPEGPLDLPATQDVLSAGSYYRNCFDTLSQTAARLRYRASIQQDRQSQPVRARMSGR